MGSSSSKAAKTASKFSSANTARRYPTRLPPSPVSNRTNSQPSRPIPGAAIDSTEYSAAKTTERRDLGPDIDISAPDLALNARLRSLGPVQPNPTLSNSSTFNNPSHQLHSPNKQPRTQTHPPSSTNRTSSHDSSLSHFQFEPSASNPRQSIFPDARQNPAVSLLTARFRLAEEADKEFGNLGKKGSAGRSFLDVVTMRRVLVLRDEEGLSAREIERIMELKDGTVGRLGTRGVVGATGVGELG